MERFSILDVPREVKIQILNALDYDVDGDFVVKKDGSRVIDKYTNKQVSISNMLIFPGSTIILDNNEVSIANYIEEHSEKDL